jgi:hypothetical protein
MYVHYIQARMCVPHNLAIYQGPMRRSGLPSKLQLKLSRSAMNSIRDRVGVLARALSSTGQSSRQPPMVPGR